MAHRALLVRKELQGLKAQTVLKVQLVRKESKELQVRKASKE
jgi:hypothetical protein